MQNKLHCPPKQHIQIPKDYAEIKESRQNLKIFVKKKYSEDSQKKNTLPSISNIFLLCFEIGIQNMLSPNWDSITSLKKYWKIFPTRKRSWKFNISAIVPLLLAIATLLESCCIEGRKLKRPESCSSSTTNEETKSFLWRTVTDPPSYFFGTIHVPYSRVWDHVPDNVKKAFETADAVFFELDLTDPGTINALSTCQLLPAGQSLADLLPSDVYNRLRRHLDYVKKAMPSWMSPDQRGRGLYADYLFRTITGNWEKKRPIWVMLMVNSLTESDIKSRGIPVLDLYLAQEAERRNKRMGAVEKVEEQCVPLNGLHLSQVVFALNQTLHHAESLRTGDLSVQFTTDDLIKHYNCGDLDAVIFNQDTAQVPTLTNATLSPLEKMMAKRIDDYFRQELIFKRNRRMGQRVLELLKAHPEKSFFFAFGAGHFLGNHTVLDVVQAGGYSVEQLSSNQRILRHKKKPQSRLREVLLPEPSSLKNFSPYSGNSAKLRREQVPQSSSGTSNANVESVVPSGNPQTTLHRTTFRPPTLLRTSHNVILPHLTDRTHLLNDKYRNFNELWVRIESDQRQDSLRPAIVRDTTNSWFTSKPYRSSAIRTGTSLECLLLIIFLARLLLLER